MAFTLTNTFNVTDSPDFELFGAVGLATGIGGGKQLLFVAGASDDGITNFQITKTGHLKKVQAINNGGGPAFELDGAIGLTKV